MKTLKYKQIFLIIAIAVISLTTSIFAAITCVNVINNNASFNAGPSVIVPTLPPGDGGGTSSKWSGSGNATYPYLIKTIAELNALADEVNGGNTYAGVYFRLENDLDYYNYNLSQYGTFNGIGTKGKIMDSTYALQVPFCGNFNGNGKKISGFVIETRKKCKMQAMFQSNYIEEIGTSLGFFGALGGEAMVYNLHLDNFRLKLNLGSTQYDSVAQYIGGIAGAIVPWGNQDKISCNPTISGCKVTNMKAYKGDTDKATNIIVGSILGQFGDGSTTCGDATGYRFTIKDCYVADVNFSESSAVIRGVYVGNIRIGTIKEGQSPPNLQDLILKGSNNDFYADADSNHKPFPAAGNTVGGPSGGTYLAGVTKTNVYTDETQSSYTLSSVGYAGGTSGTTWYRASGYKSGVPQLRVFMDWRLVKATVRGSGVFNEGIYLPSDYSRPAGADLGKSNTITLLQQRMTLTRPSGCLNSTDHGTGSPSAEITGWVGPYRDKDNTFSYYIMEWKEITRTVTLSMSTDANKYQVYYGTSTTNLTILKSEDGPITITIKCGTKISISVEKYLNNIAIKSVTYSFKDSSDKDRVIKFTTEGLGYYITSVKGNSSVATSGGGIIAIVNPGLGVEIVNRFTTTAGGTDYWHWDFSFAVETEEKTYIPNFP